MTANVSTLDEAYAECKRITHEQARNFSYGIRLLPAQKRSSLSRSTRSPGAPTTSATTRTCRRRPSSSGSPPCAPSWMTSARRPTTRCCVALDDTRKRFPLPLDALQELIDGIEMDVRGTTYETFDDLVLYCRRVAGTVGRLCLAIFGDNADPDAADLADRLGVALQQTNILRDVREDLHNGRVYLPAEDLEKFGVTLKLDDQWQSAAVPSEPFEELIRADAERAEQWYRDGFALLDLLDRRSFACCAAMAGIYHRLNGVIARDPSAIRTAARFAVRR